MSSPNKPGAAHASQVDSGSRVRTLYALEPQILVAADVDDAQTLTGATIDRAANEMTLSGQFAYPLLLPLASGEVATVAILLQDADTSNPNDPTDDTPGSFADYPDSVEQPDPQTVQGNDDGSPIETTLRFNVDLAGARRFVRANPTITIPGSGEAVSVAGVFVAGGTETYPL